MPSRWASTARWPGFATPLKPRALVRVQICWQAFDVDFAAPGQTRHNRFAVTAIAKNGYRINLVSGRSMTCAIRSGNVATQASRPLNPLSTR